MHLPCPALPPLPLPHAVLLLGFTQTIYEVVEPETQAVCLQIINGSVASGVTLGVYIDINDGG